MHRNGFCFFVKKIHFHSNSDVESDCSIGLKSYSSWQLFDLLGSALKCLRCVFTRKSIIFHTLSAYLLNSVKKPYGKSLVEPWVMQKNTSVLIKISFSMTQIEHSTLYILQQQQQHQEWGLKTYLYYRNSFTLCVCVCCSNQQIRQCSQSVVTNCLDTSAWNLEFVQSLHKKSESRVSTAIIQFDYDNEQKHYKM